MKKMRLTSCVQRGEETAARDLPVKTQGKNPTKKREDAKLRYDDYLLKFYFLPEDIKDCVPVGQCLPQRGSCLQSLLVLPSLSMVRGRALMV